MRFPTIISLCLTLAACGGGGSGESGEGAAPGAIARFTPGTVTTTVPSGDTAYVTLQVTPLRDVDTEVHAVVQPVPGKDPVLLFGVQLDVASSGNYTATFTTSHLLAPGNYTGKANVDFCEDEMCYSPIPNGRVTVNYNITVTAAQKAVTSTTNSISINTDQDISENRSLSLAVRSTLPTTSYYLSVTDPDGILSASSPFMTFPGEVETVSFINTYNLPAGTYTGNLEIKLCYFSPDCSEYHPGVLRIPYQVTIAPATNLTPLANWTNTTNGGFYGSDRSNNRYVPVTLDASKFKSRWLWTAPTMPEGRSLGTPYAGTGALFFIVPTTDQYYKVQALEEFNGAARWETALPGPLYNGAAGGAVAGNQVYVRTQATGNPRTLTFNPVTGASLLNIATPYSSPLAKTMSFADGLMILNNGYSKNFYAYDVADGSYKWSSGGTSDSDYSRTAADDTYVYYFGSNQLKAFKKSDGTTAFTIAGNDTPYHTTYIEPVVSGTTVLVNTPTKLMSFNTSTQALNWSVSGSFAGVPVIAGDTVYELNNGNLEARKISDGTFLWSRAPDNPDQDFVANLIVSENLVFCSTLQGVLHAIDRASHATAWSYNYAGTAAVSPAGVLYLYNYSGLKAINLQ